MLNFGNKEFRNLQEQVGKNKEDIERINQGVVIAYYLSTLTDIVPFTTEANVGKYFYIDDVKKLYTITHRSNEGLIAISLGDYPAKGPKGDTGDTGTGIQGEQGYGIIGFGSVLPSTARVGDFFIQSVQVGTGWDYLLKKFSATSNWVTQCSLRGPQGPKGEDGDEVTANPDDPAVDNLTKIMIDGVIYSINELTNAEKAWIANMVEYVSIDASGNISFGHDVEIDGSLTVNSQAEFLLGLDTGGISIANGVVSDSGASITPSGVTQALAKTISVMDTPSSTTLSQAQITKITNGAFINGTFLNIINPLFFPASSYDGDYYGYVIGQVGAYGNGYITKYKINGSTKVISTDANDKYILCDYDGNFELKGLLKINSKRLPNYPSDSGTYTYKCVNGVLTWVAD